MQWNPFKKKTEKELVEEQKIEAMLDTMARTQKMNAIQRFMAKRVLSLPPEKRQEVLQKAMTPKNVEKHKGEILAQLEALKKSGQMSDDQYRLAKRRLGVQ